jgi:hypothetical protein
LEKGGGNMGTLIGLIMVGITENEPEMVIRGITEIIPILLIIVVSLVFGILNYRTNRKILKKLESREEINK